MAECNGKAGYRNLHSALVVARKYGQRPYECPRCRAWHLSSIPEKDFVQGKIKVEHIDVRSYNVTLEQALLVVESARGLSSRRKIRNLLQITGIKLKVRTHA